MANLVINGDFENGNTTSWTFETGKVYIGGVFSKRKRDFNTTPPNPPQPRVISATTAIPQINQAMIPPQGSQMLQINDLDGGNHVTRCSQIINLPDNLPTECTSLKFHWAAILQGSDHDEKERPMFLVKIDTRKNNGNWKEFREFEFAAPNDGGDGWSDIGTGLDNFWYKSGYEEKSLWGLDKGSEIRVQFTAEDCTEGGHGGTAFIDGVEIDSICDGLADEAIPGPFAPNSFSPNGDGINDVWGVSGLDNACSLEVIIFDRWGGEIVHSKRSSPDGTWPSFVPIWDGTITDSSGCLGCSGKKERMVTMQDTQNGALPFKLWVKNCKEDKETIGHINLIL